MKNFHKRYPAAKPCWKVGERYFLNSFLAAAEAYANTIGAKVEAVEKTAKKKKVTDKDQEDGTE